MQTLSIAKACVIPVCESEKFNLVHKFPADKERFVLWIEAIQGKNLIEKLAGLTPESIRKRFFICSRHFGLNQYKNIESRSLNLTAIPHLNLENLDEISLSKAFQLESKLEPKEEILESAMLKKEAAPKLTTAVRILNSGAPNHNLVHKVIPTGIKGSVELVNTKTIKESQTGSVKCNKNLSPAALEPSAKRIKEMPLTWSEQWLGVNRSKSETSMEISFSSENDVSPTAAASKPPKCLKTELKKSLRTEKKDLDSSGSSLDKSLTDNLKEVKSANKLLALIEVTPEQYEILNNSLSSAEISEKVTSLINFMNEKNNSSSTDNEIELKLDDGSCIKIDPFWLRDHCRCEFCYDHSTYQRKLSVLDIPDDIHPSNYSIKENKLNVIWNDKHTSNYDLDFLIKNQHNEIPEPSKLCLWNNEKLDTILKTNCQVSMRDYMSDPEVSKKVLESLYVYGVALIDGVQPTQQNTEFIIRQLFPIHKTLFGEMWTFSDAKKDHSDTAYTNNYLGPHNDNTYFNDGAGLQILHCINYAGTGGENFLIDGFHVAAKIKQDHPEVFERLTKTIVTAEYIEDAQHHKYSSPIINLDVVTGEVMQIRFNLYDRAPFKTPGNIREFYSDLKVLAREFENPENRITFKLQPGTVLIFDNWRILHGRLAYTGKRTMTGCYVARTEFQSALRVNNFIQ